MISDKTIGITTVSFCFNAELMEELRSAGFKDIIPNKTGRRLSRHELIEMLAKCDAAIIGLDIIDDSVLANTPRLKAVSKYGVGLDNIDFVACERHGVEVLHTQGVNKRSVAELAIGCMLGLFRNIYDSSNQQKQGKWIKNGGTQLSGKTVGIIGAGNIGKELVSLLKPFGCRILINDILDIKEYCDQNGLTESTKERIYEESDVISVHTPLTDLTNDMINAEAFSKMKPSVFVINTARGGIVNENDLKAALTSGSIAGAALDAYICEPPTDSELIGLPNLISTPHIGGNSAEAVQAMGTAAIQNIVRFFA